MRTSSEAQKMMDHARDKRIDLKEFIQELKAQVKFEWDQCCKHPDDYSTEEVEYLEKQQGEMARLKI